MPSFTSSHHATKKHQCLFRQILCWYSFFYLFHKNNSFFAILVSDFSLGFIIFFCVFFFHYIFLFYFSSSSVVVWIFFYLIFFLCVSEVNSSLNIHIFLYIHLKHSSKNNNNNKQQQQIIAFVRASRHEPTKKNCIEKVNISLCYSVLFLFVVCCNI